MFHMSSTIYYKGALKDGGSVNAVYDTVVRQSAGLNCKIVREADSFYIEFSEGTSEPLMFRFRDGRLNWFCKWDNPGNPDEYYRIFDLFLAVKPFFKSLRVDDDEGAWREYQLKLRPCRIRLRELSGPAELGLLERDFDAAKYDLSRFLKPGLMFLPYSEAVYCVIARDFLKIFKADTAAALDRGRILKLANKLRTDGEPFTRENFAFMFPFILLQVWIGCCLAYKVEGRVYRLADEVRGLKTNKLAAEFGLLSEFLNIHSGTVNYKHAEIKRFAAEHVNTGLRSAEYGKAAKAALTELIRDYVVTNNIDTASGGPVLIPLSGAFKEAYDVIIGSIPALAPKPEDARQSLRVLVSMLDYLGFKYVGVEG
jgi:hypothetical protein